MYVWSKKSTWFGELYEEEKKFREIKLISLISYTCFHLASASALNSDPFNHERHCLRWLHVNAPNFQTLLDLMGVWEINDDWTFD